MSSVATAHSALEAARFFRLPFARQAWRGTQGNWRGAGLGSSIDFQDHRAYAPGDDPRYIHWAAFARTGQLTMKLYRAENAPSVDLVVDVSRSMRFEPEKLARVNELLAFCVRSAEEAGAPLRLHAVDGAAVKTLSLDVVRSGRGLEPSLDSATADQPARAAAAPLAPPWRPGALKVFISDLLFPGEPAAVLGPLASGTGLGLVLAPTTKRERELEERGNFELCDCEGGTMRRQRIDDALAARYRAAYQRHFADWAAVARQRGALLATVACEGPLKEALAAEPLRHGLVEHHA